MSQRAFRKQKRANTTAGVNESYTIAVPPPLASERQCPCGKSNVYGRSDGGVKAEADSGRAGGLPVENLHTYDVTRPRSNITEVDGN